MLKLLQKKGLAIAICMMLLLIPVSIFAAGESDVEEEVVISDLDFTYPQSVIDWSKEVKSLIGGQEITVASIASTAMDAWRVMTPDFEKLTGVKVNWYSVELSKLHDRYLLDYAGKVGSFDIMYASKSFGYELYELGALESIQPWIDNEKPVKTPDWFDYDDFIPSLRYVNEDLNGDAFAMPATGECAVMAYREDLFEKYGLSYPETWQDVLETAKFFNEQEIYENGVRVYGFVMRGRAAFGGANFPVPLVGFNWGAKLFDYDTQKAVWQSQEAIDSVQFLIDLCKYGNPQISSLSATEAISSFAQGEAAMCIEVTALMPVVENPESSNIAGKVHYEPVPQGPANDFNTLSGAGLSMSSQTKNKDAAYAFMMWMLGKANENIYIENGGVVVRQGLLESRADMFPYFNAAIKGFEQAERMVEAGYDGQPKTKWTMAFTNAFAKYGSAAFAGQMTAEEAVEAMQQEFEEAMQQ